MEKVKYEPCKTHQRYKTKAGDVVPGCSTICKIGDDPGGLIHWAWQLGCDGQDYKKTRDAAATAGTLSHWMMECYIKGVEPDLSEFSPAMVSIAESQFIKILDWWKDNECKLIASEMQLVSNQFRFGGTFDILCDSKKGVMLADIKTCKALYPSNWFQIAGLNQLIIENELPKPVRFAIIRTGQTDNVDDFETPEKSNMRPFWNVFESQLNLYWAKKKIK